MLIDKRETCNWNKMSDFSDYEDEEGVDEPDLDSEEYKEEVCVCCFKDNNFWKVNKQANVLKR